MLLARLIDPHRLRSVTYSRPRLGCITSFSCRSASAGELASGALWVRPPVQRQSGRPQGASPTPSLPHPLPHPIRESTSFRRVLEEESPRYGGEKPGFLAPLGMT